jgi:hypothetical protein
LWLIAVALTLFLGRHQRVTGPTYPLSGRATLGTTSFAWELKRTHAGPGGQRVEVTPGIADATGTVHYRPHVMPGAPDPGPDAWIAVPMAREGDALAAELPHQPIAGKLDYRVTLEAGGRSVTLPPQGHATIRFRNDVPVWVLLPHIAFMFVAMLLSTRAGLEVLERKPNFAPLVNLTLITLFIGGFPLGFAMSGYAFHEPWGGFPLGNDATDNKTLVAMAAWLGAWIALRTGRGARLAVPAAAVIMFVVYLIPHSLALPK